VTQVPPAVYIVVSLLGAAVILTWRYRETSSPVTVPKLLIPPLAMSTGLCMFLAPETRVPLLWALAAFAVGALVFWWPLWRSSKLTKQGEQFLMKRSPAFLWILLGLVAVRLALRSYVELYVSQLQTGALFYLLALGAVARWRLALFLELKKLQAATSSAPLRQG
jgi:membrane protein CcdC involved in cytochrome C biogenesis